jgi:YVTN family beta-propeller protein
VLYRLSTSISIGIVAARYVPITFSFWPTVSCVYIRDIFYIHDEFRINYYGDLELRKGSFLLAMLEIMILISAILISHNIVFGQTYDDITTQREMFKNNPQIPVGSSPGLPLIEIGDIAINERTNKIYVSNPDSNTVSVIDSNTGNVTNKIRVGTHPFAIAVNQIFELAKKYITPIFPWSGVSGSMCMITWGECDNIWIAV